MPSIDTDDILPLLRNSFNDMLMEQGLNQSRDKSGRYVATMIEWMWFAHQCGALSAINLYKRKHNLCHKPI